MSGTAPFALDTPRVRRAFDRAGVSYDAAAVVQADVRDTLIQRLDFAALAPRVVLDAGAGTGLGARALKRRYPAARVIALDSSFGMLRVAARRRGWRRRFDCVCADASALPLPDGCVELILSNLMLPWCDPDAALGEFRRVLAPRGLLAFTSLGPDTLRELRSAWASVDDGGHVHAFVDMHDLGDALVRNGFAAPVLDVERYTVTYADGDGLMADLKATGAHNAAARRARGLTGRRKFAAMRSAYEQFRQDGRLPATVEIVFGHAWGPLWDASGAGVDGVDGVDGGGGAAVSLDEFKRQLGIKRRP